MTAPEENYDPVTGLLSKLGLERALETEMARSARHELPIALVYLEVTGLGLAGESLIRRRVLGAAAEVLLGRVRAEDRVARVHDLRFAVLAPEAGDARALALRLADHLLRHLQRLGGEAETVAVAAAGVDCQFDEMTAAELQHEAELELVAALVARDAATKTSGGAGSPNGFTSG